MKDWRTKWACWAALLAFALAAQAGPVLMVGESAPMHVGDAFTVSIRVAGAVDLKAFQFDLAYDPLVLEAVGFSDAGTDFEAVALAGGGALTGLTGFLFPGGLSGVADSMSGVADGLYGSGVLANIEFRAIGPGVSALTLSNAFVDFVPLDAGSMVSGIAVVAEPGSLGLAVLALGCLARRRFRLIHHWRPS